MKIPPCWQYCADGAWRHVRAGRCLASVVIRDWGCHIRARTTDQANFADVVANHARDGRLPTAEEVAALPEPEEAPCER